MSSQCSQESLVEFSGLALLGRDQFFLDRAAFVRSLKLGGCGVYLGSRIVARRPCPSG